MTTPIQNIIDICVAQGYVPERREHSSCNCNALSFSSGGAGGGGSAGGGGGISYVTKNVNFSSFQLEKIIELAYEQGKKDN